MRAGVVVIAAGLAGIVALQLLAHNRAQAAAEATAQDDTGPAVSTAWDALDLWGFSAATFENHQVQTAMQDLDRSGSNLAAFLSMIATSEGTDRAADPYRVCYGYRHTIDSFADHPAVTGEWKGEDISDLGPQYAGKVSTAAGRYQMRRQTWLECKTALGLPDFSPASQDKAAVFLIRRRRAIDAVQAGRVADAIALCRQEWASLPGAGYGQGERQLATLESAYTNAGGTLA